MPYIAITSVLYAKYDVALRTFVGTNPTMQACSLFNVRDAVASETTKTSNPFSIRLAAV